MVLFERFRLRYEDAVLSLNVNYEGTSKQLAIFHGSVRSAASNTMIHLDASTDEDVCIDLICALEWRGYEVEIVT